MSLSALVAPSAPSGPDVVAIRLDFELDLATTAQLERLVLAAADRERPQRIVVDLTDCSFIDLVGWHTLRRLVTALADRGCHMCLVGSTPRLRSLLALLDTHCCSSTRCS
jgi:anti-anti-sigma factor